MKILNFLFLVILLILISCVSGNAPTMSRKIKIWNGAPEQNGICRMSTNDLADKLNTISFFIKPFHKGTKSFVCIDASNDEFKNYASLTFDDLGVLYGFIEEMQLKCEKWKE